MSFDSLDSEQATPRSSRASNATASGEGRSEQLLENIRSLLANEQLSVGTSGAGIEGVLNEFCAVVVTDFCDWCVVDLVDGERDLEALPMSRLERHSSLCGQRDELHEPRQIVPQLLQLGQKALLDDATQVWPEMDAHSTVACFVVPLFIHHTPYAAVSFIASSTRSFGAEEVAAGTQAVKDLSQEVERLAQSRHVDVSPHQADQLMGQLNLLHEASITLATLSDEREIMLYLARALRHLYDADVARVALRPEQLLPLWSLEKRGQAPVCNDTNAVAPPWPPGEFAKGSEATSMTAPLGDGSARSRGFINVQRIGGEDFGSDDAQILQLFAQIATTALEAAELHHVILSGETRLRLLIDSAPIGIIEMGKKRDIRWWNRSAAQIFQWPTFDSHSPLAPSFPLSVEDHFGQVADDAFARNSTTSTELTEVTIGDEVKDLTVLATLLPSSDGRGECIWTLVNDVTSRGANVDLDESETKEFRGRAASSVAHDFNNLLSLISGYAEILLKDHARDKRAVQVVSDIQSVAARASMLTMQLQTVGKTISMDPVVLCPADEINRLAEVLERIVGGNIHIVWSLDPTVGNVRIDADQFEQMILNLTVNARDAMPSGGDLRISVDEITLEQPEKVDRKLAMGEYVLISVTDTGIGMDHEVLEHCFDPMFTTKGPLKGTGLGLSTARRLVETSGGVIHCLSERGQGTTFNIFLPKSYDVRQPKNAALTSEHLRGSAKVLVVEEDEGLRHLVTRALERNGHQILEADNAQRARELEEAFDGNIELLVVGNFPAPVDSTSLAAQLRAKNPKLKFLFLGPESKSTKSHDVVGADCAFMNVPFKPSELIEIVHQLVPPPTVTK